MAKIVSLCKDGLCLIVWQAWRAVLKGDGDKGVHVCDPPPPSPVPSAVSGRNPYSGNSVPRSQGLLLSGCRHLVAVRC